ncbi:hypothetical protein [Streptomyces syringium]|uniref:hypothetical protein n=1 Tax=Streptomyces syringium TaxID=76729 RepID=UPI003437EFF2
MLLVPGDDGPRVTLVTPPTLAGGAYRLDAGTKELEKEGLGVQGGMPEGAVSVLGRYQRVADHAVTLSLSGAYGGIGEPDAVLDGMFKGFESGPGKPSVAGERRTFTPEGPDGPAITCELVKMYDRAYAPACAWAEASDAMLVLDFDPARRSADSVDLAAFAKTTAGLYRDVRKPT